MARPRLDDEERRVRTVGVRVTAAEAAELRERAQAARLSMGAYLRRRALGQRVRMAAELRLGAAELRELNRIGVNLNQMARALNSRAVSSPAGTRDRADGRAGELSWLITTKPNALPLVSRWQGGKTFMEQFPMLRRTHRPARRF